MNAHEKWLKERLDRGSCLIAHSAEIAKLVWMLPADLRYSLVPHNRLNIFNFKNQ